MTLLSVWKSTHRCKLPSFFFTKRTGDPHRDLVGWIKPFCVCSSRNCHAPSQLNLGELSHTHIHLMTDCDSTQLNTPPCMGNMEHSPTRTSLTLMDISRQAGMAC